MAHELIRGSDGRYSMAFMGDRNSIWHRHGQQAQADWTLDQWLKEARLDYSVEKRQAYILIDGKPTAVDGQYFLARKDNDYVLSGSVTEQFKVHDVRPLAEAFAERVAANDLYKFDTMGAVLGGRKVWFLAKINGEHTIGGDAHNAYLMSTTAFDGTMATLDKIVCERVVCANTLAIATSQGSAVSVRSTHRSHYDKARVATELAELAKNVERFKAFGDAMATVALVNGEVSTFFKAVLDIPFDAKQEDISARKFNMFDSLRTAYRTTVDEGTQANTAWTALQAVTRYVDHDRSTRGNNDNGEGRFVSAQFGSGAQLKQKAWNLLLPLVKDKVAIAA